MLARSFLIAACVLCSTSGARAQTMYLQENLPYSSDSPAQGFMLQIVRDMAQILHKDVPALFMDWSEAQKTVRAGRDGIIFPFSRTAAREANYAWLLKFWDVNVGFFVREGRPVVESYEEAAAQPSIGVIGGSAWDDDLKVHKLSNVRRYENALRVAAAVAAGEVTAGYGPEIEIKYAWLSRKLHGTARFGRTLLVGAQWIATSKDAPSVNVEDWRQAFEVVQQDGTFDRLYAQYFGSKG